MNETRFRTLLAELIDENPFAVRAVLRILAVEFTTAVRTLAVTCEERPRLLVNLDFVRAHCRTDAEVKALVCHEFLHVLLRHTEARVPFTPARHLAMDAVINAIIHRQHGEAYSSMMSRYYAEVGGVWRLLRPMTPREVEAITRAPGGYADAPEWMRAWHGLYEGVLVADDIEALAQDIRLAKSRPKPLSDGQYELELADEDSALLLGNHDEHHASLPDALEGALREAMREMNGSGIWRAAGARSVSANAYEALVNARDEPLERWRRKTLALLREHLTLDSRSRKSCAVARDYRIPVLSPGDRRAFLRSRWSPFLPEALWQGATPQREGTAQVYLDVSGSMYAEMPLVIALLARLTGWIRRPLWAFSNVVAPAVIDNGRLKAATTGGTSMACVLEHVARTRPAAAVVLTDGYIERLDRTAVSLALAATQFTALVTRDGNPAELHRAGIPYRQLDKVPA